MDILYSFGTPNGIKPTILLEELNRPYSLKLIDISKGEQFQPDFSAIAPNHKIPVFYEAKNNWYLSESVAILQYLAEEGRAFLPQHPLSDKYRVLQWCYFQAAHVGPMFGQFGHFYRFAQEKIPYAIKRYQEESMRLLYVIEQQLEHYPFIFGGDYTIADMAIWPWIYGWHSFYEQPLEKEKWPQIVRWYQDIAKRPAVIQALKHYGKKIED